MKNLRKKILVLDVHASEGGAFSILNDFYEQVSSSNNNDYEWEFIVSTPEYTPKKFLNISRFPWVKKSAIFRLFFDIFILPLLIKRIKPDLIANLQNKAVNFKGIPEIVYLHLPFILTDYNFRLFRDEFKLWFYQKFYKFIIFKSYKKVKQVIVQTSWMKDELIAQGNFSHKLITVNYPVITTKFNNLKLKRNINFKKFFYPATSFSYKNHGIILKAVKELQQNYGVRHSVSFTIDASENRYASHLSKYADHHNLDVNFIGSINREEVITNYLSSCLIFPSFIESFGLPLLEARILNIPILAISSPFSHEILKDYQNAIFFDGNNHEDLQEKILLIKDKFVRNKTHDEFRSKNSLIDLITHNYDY